ncbi:TonB family protein [Herbaspirillum sp. RV1423]|uniref:TonB family protein n=1 Tax=Herbaspirillum sp. RV1423 TaxID=1443993 RepID=UPI0009DECE4D|nr:TonB family protein [Herbaspirillum sp. RV1423]
MTASSALVGVLTLAGCLVSTGISATQAVVQSVLPGQGETDEAELFSFNIASIPLSLALQQYASLTHYPTLFRSELVANRTSTAIQGDYAAEDALHVILTGTGLIAEEFNSGASRAFILKLASDNLVVKGEQRWVLYSRLLQKRIWQTLCSSPRTAPGQYRTLLRFRVDAIGKIQQSVLLTSTGDKGRDKAVLDVLRQLQMNPAPPVDMPQPLTMLIVPNDAEASMRCDESNQDRNQDGRQ